MSKHTRTLELSKTKDEKLFGADAYCINDGFMACLVVNPFIESFKDGADKAFAEDVIKRYNAHDELMDKIESLSKRGICDMQDQIKELMNFVKNLNIPSEYDNAKREELLKQYGGTE